MEFVAVNVDYGFNDCLLPYENDRSPCRKGAIFRNTKNTRSAGADAVPFLIGAVEQAPGAGADAPYLGADSHKGFCRAAVAFCSQQGHHLPSEGDLRLSDLSSEQLQAMRQCLQLLTSQRWLTRSSGGNLLPKLQAAESQIDALLEARTYSNSLMCLSGYSACIFAFGFIIVCSWKETSGNVSMQECLIQSLIFQVVSYRIECARCFFIDRPPLHLHLITK
jgi:hypothetical protein